MERSKKIRGLSRRRSGIEEWIQSSKMLDIHHLNEYKYDRQKIWVDPWANLFITKQPPNDYRNQITSGLIEIYFSWKKELEKLNEPYYLKIWLYQPRFMMSQVVAGIEERIGYYQNCFHHDEDTPEFPITNFAKAKSRIDLFNWTAFLDEDTVAESEYDGPIESYHSKEDYWYCQRMMRSWRKKHDNKYLASSEGNEDIYYSRTQGLVWCSSEKIYMRY